MYMKTTFQESFVYLNWRWSPTAVEKEHTPVWIRGLQGCDAVWNCGGVPAFRWSVLPPSSGWSEMEAACTSGASVSCRITARRHGPEDLVSSPSWKPL